MARKKRADKTPAAVAVVSAPEPVLEPIPRFCQFPNGCRPGTKPFARLTFKSKAGMIWTESSCQGHQEARTDQIRREGGELLAVLVLEGEDIA